MRRFLFVLAFAFVGMLLSCRQSISEDAAAAPEAQVEDPGSDAAPGDLPDEDAGKDAGDSSNEQIGGSEAEVEDGHFVFRILKDGTASVIGMSDDGKGQEKLDIPSKIMVQDVSPSQSLSSKGGTREISVTSIGEGAFEGNAVLASIHIPSTVTVIGSNAFKGCGKLETVNIPDGVAQINAGTFEGCGSLESISLGNVSDCDPSAFSNCGSLKEIVAMESIAEVLSDFFEGADESQVQVLCIKASDYFRYTDYYQHVRIDGLTEQGKQLETIEIPYEINGLPVTEMDYDVLVGSRVKKLVIPSSFTSISVYSCECCDTLEEVYLPESIRYIDTYAFRGNRSLKKVVMKEGVETIGVYAFLDCSSLREVELPYSVRNSMTYAFLGCPLESMVISDDTDFNAWGIDADKISYKASKYIYDEIEDGIVIKGVNKEIFGHVQGEFVFPDKIKGISVVEIADSADFSGCGFVSISFPASIRRIGANAFAGCPNLSWVRVSASAEVDESAFPEGVGVIRLGGSSDNGSISSRDSIFTMNIEPNHVLIESLKQDYIDSAREQLSWGGRIPLEICIPYEVDGIPVRDVFMDQIISRLSYEVFDQFRDSRMTENYEYDDMNHRAEDASQCLCIIYLPVDSNMRNPYMAIEYLIEFSKDRIAETGAPIMVYLYYCPELD